jgi:hypothetical protein
MNNVKQLLNDIWTGALDLELTINGHEAWVEKCRGGFFRLQSKQAVLYSHQSKFVLEQVGDEIRGHCWSGQGFKYILVFTPAR